MFQALAALCTSKDACAASSGAGGKKARAKTVRDNFRRRYENQANRFRKELGDWYGAEKAKEIKYAEGFEICEYGAQPDKAGLNRLFPFHE